MKLIESFIKLHTIIIPVISGPLHDTRDENNCLSQKGFSWCEDIQECIRIWETPCRDNFISCENCLFRQSLENIACPEECFENHEELLSQPCSLCPPPPVCPSPGPDCFYLSLEEDNCGCIVSCGEVTCQTPSPPPQVINDPCPITQSTCSIYDYVCPIVTEITHCSEDGIEGFTTYQLSLFVKDHNQVKNIYALFGEHSNHEMYFPPAYQIDGPFNSDIGGVSPSIIQIFPNSRFDSWITIDITDGDPDNLLSTIGIDFNSWSETHGISTSNGAIFQIDPNYNNFQNEYIIGQITLPNEVTDSLIVNVQGKKVNEDSWKEYNVRFNLDPSEIIQNPIPFDCVLWYDGCNLCQVTEGRLGLCSSNSCLIYGDTLCHSYSHTGH